MRSVVLLLLGAHLAYAGTHSFKAFYIATTGINNSPEFTAMAVVDGIMMNHYDSISKQVVPRTEWIKNSEGPDYWKQQTDIIMGTEQNFKNNIQVAMGRFNQTEGVHTVQMMCGCELHDDGTKRGYYLYGYDGEDFLSLDKSTLTWTASNPQAMITKVKWDSTGAHANIQNNYLDNTCIEWLNKYVDYGKGTLERKASPQVSLLQKSSSPSVTCHATGFYPSGVKISWMKNDQEHDEDVNLGELLPNEDGTFQKTSTITVTPEEWKNNKFSCVVEHQGKTQIRTNEGGVPIVPIVGGLVAVVLLIAIAGVVYVVYKKKQGEDQKNKQGFKPVNGSEDGSSNSSARPEA